MSALQTTGQLFTGRVVRATSGWLLLLSVAAFAQQGAASASGATLTRAEQQAAAQLQIKALREVTVALTAKEMEGRGTGQPGADRAAQYLADRFRRGGLRPGAPNGWLQPAEFNSDNHRTAPCKSGCDASLEE